MKPRVNLCPCCITLKCLSWLKLQVGILNNYYLPVLVAANGGPRKQVLWPFSGRMEIPQQSDDSTPKSVCHYPLAVGTYGSKSQPFKRHSSLTNVTNVTNDCCSFGIIDHLSDATPRFYPLSMVQYWFCMVLLALSPLELSISVPSSPGSGGAQAPQSPIPTPDPPTARRSRVYLAGLVPRKKGLVIYP